MRRAAPERVMRRVRGAVSSAVDFDVGAIVSEGRFHQPSVSYVDMADSDGDSCGSGCVRLRLARGARVGVDRRRSLAMVRSHSPRYLGSAARVSGCCL